ncbi:hypothetical protein [uncultured Tateyamaria sp.]|uniref:hypothetical protein n=1 Tax=Tateyamaria sp. 1078 TaxID=3417464 RepID=UPI002639CFC3|nr:hypothetical protein [uncultured Tateyamaria sp.]
MTTHDALQRSDVAVAETYRLLNDSKTMIGVARLQLRESIARSAQFIDDHRTFTRVLDDVRRQIAE